LRIQTFENYLKISKLAKKLDVNKNIMKRDIVKLKERG